MKQMRFLLMILMVLMGIGTLQAQTLQVWRNGTADSRSIKGVERLTFAKACPTADGVSYVNLGLPSGTMWTIANVGASSLEQKGTAYSEAEASAAQTDVCKLPTSAQVQELLDRCEQKAVTMNGVAGVLFSASNGSTLFLPCNIWTADGKQLVQQDGKFSLQDATASASVRLVMPLPLSGSIEDPEDGGSYDI